MKIEGTYKSEGDAWNCAKMFNAAAEHDKRCDKPVRYFYFVQPVSKEQLREAVAEKYRRRHSEDRKRFVVEYGPKVRPYTREMASAMLYSIMACEGEKDGWHNTQGARLDAYGKYVKGIGYLTCSGLYYGYWNYCLEVAVIRDDEIDASVVETFSDTRILKSWLLDAVGAAAAFENRLMDILYEQAKKGMIH